MRNSILIAALLLALLGMFAISEAGAMPMFGEWTDTGQKSPATAALLSLIPMPVAAGQFYAGDWTTGLLFSFVETAEMTTAFGVAVYEGGSMMFWGAPIRDWNSTSQTVFYLSVGGFVLTKFMDAVTAALIADAHNKALSPANVSLVLRDREVGFSFDYRY